MNTTRTITITVSSETTERLRRCAREMNTTLKQAAENVIIAGPDDFLQGHR
jgi:hypothetical protein